MSRNCKTDWKLADDLWGRLSDVKIAEELGCSKNNVVRYRKKHNISTTFSHAWIPWHLAEPLWGKQTDRLIAEKLGCSKKYVGKYRRKKQIPPCQDKTFKVKTDCDKMRYVRFNPEEIQKLSETMTAKEVAKVLGCSPNTVRRIRGKSVVKPDATDWKLVEDSWGRLNDSEIAQKMGCSTNAVVYYRKKHNISAAHAQGWIPWDQAESLWGKKCDRVIAEQLGCSKASVVAYRRKKKIPACPIGASDTGKNYVKFDREEIRRLLETMEATEVAKKIGCSLHTVNVAKGTTQNEFYKINLELAASIWGTHSDIEIAKILNCSVWSVRNYRKKHGIKNGNRINWSQAEHLWGKECDRVIAEHLNCALGTVTKYRNKNNIKSALSCGVKNRKVRIDKKEILELLKTMKPAKVAEKMNCSPATVWNTSKKSGTRVRKIAYRMATHPGQIISDLLKANSTSTSLLSQKTGIHEEELQKLLNGEIPMSRDLAIALSGFFPGKNAQHWLYIQSFYDMRQK